MASCYDMDVMAKYEVLTEDMNFKK